MPALAQLSRVSSLRGVARYFATLGIQGAWHRLDPGAAHLGVPLRQLAVVTPEGSLPWLFLHGRGARQAATQVARARARLGSPAGIACLDSACRRLAVSVALPGAPVLELSLDHPDPVACAVLERLPSLAGRGVLEGAATLSEWLAIEATGTRFFRAFRRAFERMCAALPRGPDPQACEALALLQLTRVLFLYFVQSKGWLDGRTDFLAAQVDQCLARGRNLHRHLLHPLWFGTLSCPPAARGRPASAFGRIPFLNGGLFDVHPLERRWRCDLPNAEWRVAFDDVFERFQFVTREGDATAIGPDTLGHVFEQLMDPTLRRASGTFYTPAPLVERLVRAGIAAWVAQQRRLSLVEADAMLQRPDESLRCALRGLTILDPAAGSGAFLLGALEQLAHLTRGPGERVPDARRRVIARNLFGVDLNPTALRLAELRLWLAVIAHENDTPGSPVTPLPNLDAVVRQGDSLWGHGEGHVLPDAGTAARVREVRRAFVGLTGPAKRRAGRALRQAEEAAARAALHAAIARLDHRIREVIEAARAPTLFGDRTGTTREAMARLASARRSRRALRESLRRLDRTGELAHFDYAVQFGDILAEGGFGLVAGNPPWVRGESIPAETRRRLAARYRWYGQAPGRGYRNAADLSVAFVERSFELLQGGGVLALLVPAKVRHAGYAERLRTGLAQDATLHAVAEATPDDARAFGATVYPMALVAGKCAAPPGHLVQTSLEHGGPSVSQAALTSGPWILGSATAERAAREVLSRHPRLGSRWRVQVGVKTGADHVFLTREPDIEPRLLRRALRGRDLTPEGARPALWLRWPCTAEGLPLAQLPPRAEAWFHRHAALLRRRADYRGGPPWQLFRTGAAVQPHRVVWADLARTLTAVPLAGREVVPLNTCYVVGAAHAPLAHALTCFLNSTWCRGLALCQAPLASGGYRRFNARVVEHLPLPTGLDAHLPAGIHPVRPGMQAERDDLAAELLGLTTTERDALAELSGAAG
jgi:hypothetical protein